MKKTKILSKLESICERLSIIVKYDRFFGQGGYCRLRNQAYFIINKRLSNEAKEQLFIKELKTINFDPSQLPPQLQEFIKEQ